MSTPVLSKQQQKHSLSAKKSLTKGLRNVLAQPQENYWPVVKAEKCPNIEDILKKLMPAIKRPMHTIPWSQLRHMKKEERSQAKKEALLNQENVANTEIIFRNSIIMGLNAITRALERNDVCCVLIDANIESQLLIKHIILMAQNKKVPTLLLPNFKVITLSAIGFASAACALKNTVMESPDHHFHPLYLQIYDIYKDIPIPKHSLQLLKDESLDKTTLHADDVIKLEDEPELNTEKSIKFTLSTNVYKYRTSRKERAFIPPTAAGTSVDDTIAVKTEEDFISISNYDDDEFDTNIKRHSRYVNIRGNEHTRNQRDYTGGHGRPANVPYLPLKVKRLQGNSNRLKATKASKQKKR